MVNKKHKGFLFLAILLSCSLQLGGIDIYLRLVNLPGDVQPSRINTIMPDSSGFIWLATSNGLYRWDGLRALNYPAKIITGSINVTALTVDNKGMIWAGCDDGSIFHTSGQELTPWRLPDTSIYSRINDLLFDAHGHLWWGTNGSGLFFFNGTDTLHLSTEDGLPDNYMYNLERGNYGEIWASTDRGIAVCKSWEGLHEVSAFERKDGLDDDIVRVVQKDRNGNMWLGFHEGGVCYFDNTEKSFMQPANPYQIKYGRIDAFAMGKTGLWVADKQNGLLFSETVNPAEFKVVEMHGEELPEQIKLIRSDPMGNLWILDRDQLFVSSGGAFTRISKINNYDITAAKAVILYDDQSTWLAEDHSIMEISNGSQKRYLSGKISKTSTITSAKVDSKGFFWIGTFGDGVILFDPQTKIHRFINERDGLVNNSVLHISIRNDNVWVSTLGGASHLKASTVRTDLKYEIDSYDKENGLGNNFIYCVLQDSKNDVWFGTDGNGLVKYDGSSFSFYDQSSGLGDDVVYSMVEDKDGDFWINTASAGIQRFDGKVFTNFLPSEGPKKNIISVATSGDYVFILTESAMEILDKVTGNYARINEELDLRQVNAQLNNAYTDDGLVCFVTEQGIIRINTHRLADFETSPRLTMDKISINLEPVVLPENAILESNENKLVFEYMGFWHLAPGKVHYMTRLNGYDPNWHTTYDRRAIYANLFPGDYQFEVKAFLDNTPSDKLPVTINFSILKPVYARWWFILVAILLISGLILWLIRFRERKLKEKESRQKEKLEFEFQTLKNQINPHFLFNSFSTLIYMIEEEPKLAAGYAEKMSDFFRNILEVKDKELIPLNEELRMLNDYYFIQQKRFGNNFTLDIQLDETVVHSRIPPLTLQLLTENAIKHNIISMKKPLQVTLTNDSDHIIVVNNLQMKKQAEVSTGLGLTNITERYSLIRNKKVRVETTPTEFKVFLPIIK